MNNPWKPEWHSHWPEALQYIDGLLETQYKVGVSNIVSGEKGIPGTAYHSQQTSITTTLKEVEAEEPRGNIILEGANAFVLSLLTENEYDFFVKDAHLDNSGNILGMVYHPHRIKIAPLVLNIHDQTMYQALVTRTLELDIKRITEFYNSGQDELLTNYLDAASRRVFKDYTRFLIHILFDYLCVKD